MFFIAYAWSVEFTQISLHSRAPLVSLSEHNGTDGDANVAEGALVYTNSPLLSRFGFGHILSM